MEESRVCFAQFAANKVGRFPPFPPLALYLSYCSAGQYRILYTVAIAIKMLLPSISPRLPLIKSEAFNFFMPITAALKPPPPSPHFPSRLYRTLISGYFQEVYFGKRARKTVGSFIIALLVAYQSVVCVPTYRTICHCEVICIQGAFCVVAFLCLLRTVRTVCTNETVRLAVSK